MPELIHGGRLVARALAAEGVECLFTLCGGHVQSLYDGCLDEGIRVVDTRHEQTAGHAADGWARVTGRPGVCAVTAGPGVTDVVTAVANAHRAGVPMICLGGAGPRVLTHMGSLQDMDHVELMRPITKWSATVGETRRLGEYVTAAFRRATSGVPGPVFLELPLDVLMEFVDAGEAPIPTRYRAEARCAPEPAYLDQAVDILRHARRPVALVGSQIRWSRDPQAAMDAFVATGIPTFVNGMARGLVDPRGPHFLNRSRKHALRHADAVLVCGTPFDFRLGYGQSEPLRPGSQSGQMGKMMLKTAQPVIGKDTRVVQVDLDGDEVGRNRTGGVDVGLVGDTGLALEGLAAGLADLDGGHLAAWRAGVRQVEEAAWSRMRQEMACEDDPPNPLRVCAALDRFIRPGDVVIGDGGDFVGTAAYVLKPHGLGTWMDPGPLGTLGVGPGYAMAARLARPDARVVIAFGDGSFGLHAMELEAMARQGLPVVGVIGNDAAWTQIQRGQRRIYGAERLVATSLDHTRYERIAEACGGHGEWVERATDLEPAFERAFAAGVPAVVNVKIGSSPFRSSSASV